jgi:maleylacetate reductase
LAKAIALECDVRIVAVPTTYAGSEMSPIWGISDEDGKRTGRDPRVLPRTVLYDPANTISLPSGLTATSALNAVAHAVEAAYAPDVSPIVAASAVEAVAVIARALPICVAEPSNWSARADLLKGAFLAGFCLGNATMGLHHKLCHVLGGDYNLPHSPMHAALLPFVVAYNYSAAPDAMALLAGALGQRDATMGLWELGRSVGAPRDLTSIGFDPAHIAQVAHRVSSASFANPAKVTEHGIRSLLRQASSGNAPP